MGLVKRVVNGRARGIRQVRVRGNFVKTFVLKCLWNGFRAMFPFCLNRLAFVIKLDSIIIIGLPGIFSF